MKHNNALLRKILILELFCLFFSPLFLNAQLTKEYISFKEGAKLKTISDHQLSISQDNNLKMVYSCDLPGALFYTYSFEEQIYNRLYAEGMSPFGELGQPALPAKNLIVNVNQNETPLIQILNLDTTTIENIFIEPNIDPEVQLEDGIKNTKLDQCYTKDAFYPEKWVEIIDVQNAKGQAIAIVQIHPVRFNPVRNQIQVASNIQFQIKTTALKTNQTTENETQSFLILTPNKFKPEAERFATWKRKNGFNTRLISEENWSSSKIKTTVKTVYQEQGNSLDYLLLVGDNEYMPAEEFYRPDDGEMKLYVTDLYYACMDGDDDYLPDMAYGRLPVSSSEEAKHMIDKTINYALNPPVNETYYNTVVGCAQYQDDDEDGYADRRFVQTSEDVGDYLKEKNYNYKRIYVTEEGVTPEYYNDSKYSSGGKLPDELLRENGFKWDGGSTHITEALNNGTFFMFHRDHGLTSGLGWSHPKFTVEHFSEINNETEPTILYSINCHSGKFNMPKSFAEELVLHRSGGAVAAFCASNTSFSGYNDAMFVAMVDAIWNEPGIVPDLGKNNDTSLKDHDAITALGDVLNYGKLRMLSQWSGSQSTHKHIFELFHLFGDPSMPMPTQKPKTLEVTCSEWINEGDNEYSLSISNTNDAVVTLTQGNEETDYTAYLNQGSITIPTSAFKSDSIELFIYKEGFIPYFKTIKKSKPLLHYPTSLNLGAISHSGLPHKTNLNISNSGKGELSITSVSCNDPNLTITLPENKVIAEAQEWTIQIDINDNASMGTQNTTIIIEAEGITHDIAVSYTISTLIGENFVSGLWTKANSPYYIASNVGIEDGTELIIEAGVKIHFHKDAQLIIDGSIEAIGTESEPIFFTGIDNNSWKGIVLQNNTTSTSNFEHCTINNAHNTVREGGAVLLNSYQNANFTFCKFLNNISERGGAIYAYKSKANFKNCTFDKNAAEHGGAMYFTEADLHILNCTFENNKSILYGGAGGAIYCKTSNPLIEGSLFHNNYAAFGGGVYLRDNSTGLLVNNTFSMNLANYGAGIRFKNDTHTKIYNSVFWNNEAFLGGKEIYTYDNCEPTFTNCIIKGGESKIRVYQNKAFNGNMIDCYETDPELNNSSEKNCFILSNSIAMDAGIDDIDNYEFPSFDLQQGQRFRYGTIDIGAYEFQNYKPSQVKLSSDSVLRKIGADRCIGLLSTKDKDTEDNHSYQILNSNAENFLRISNDSLYTTQALIGLDEDVITIGIRSNDDGFGKLHCEGDLSLKLSDYKTALLKPLTPITTTNYPKDTVVVLSEYFVSDNIDADLKFELSESSNPQVAEANLENNLLNISFRDLGSSQFNLTVTNGDETFNQSLTVYVTGATAINGISNQTTIFYPNPCGDEIWIASDEVNLHGEAIIEVFDLKGRICLRKKLDTFSINEKINVAKLPAGLYLIKLSSNKTLKYQQLILKK